MVHIADDSAVSVPPLDICMNLVRPETNPSTERNIATSKTYMKLSSGRDEEAEPTPRMQKTRSTESNSGRNITGNTRVKRSILGETKKVTWYIPEKEEKENIRILQFNVSSLNEGIYKIIRREKPHIICLQEIRKKMPDTHKLKTSEAKWETKNQV